MNSSFSAKKRSRALVASRKDYSPFENKLIQAEFVNDVRQLQEARTRVQETGEPLTQVLAEMMGRELPPELLRQYKRHHLFELKILFGVESLDPEIDQVDHDKVGALVNDLVPIDICRRHKVLPLARYEDPPTLVVAMVEPDNLAAQDDLNLMLRPKGIKMQRLVMALEDFQYNIQPYLDAQQKKQKQQKQQQKLKHDLQDDPLARLVQELQNQQIQRDDDEGDQDDVEVDFVDLSGLGDFDLGPEEAGDELDDDLTSALTEAKGAPVINLVNMILIKAIQEGSSDIHIEPQEKYLRIRFRKDGVLQQSFDPLPPKIAPAVAARFKIMADLDIAERRVPQDGRIRRKFKRRNVDFRVSTIPSRFGEKIVLRILDNSATQLGLDKLITDDDSLELVREMARRPFGLILVTGPTGSGKSTTLYSILAERNDPGININTAEDPIEYSLPGITQVQVLRQKGMDFASILRSFLRQDPDIILVGETRDRETAQTAIEAALTGHLVLTTLHTNDAAGAIARLDEMGVEPFMISGSLIGILAQRLMRRVCSECRIPYHPDKSELARFGLSAANEGDITFYRANKLTADDAEEARKSGILCEKCNGSGYKGRVGVYEVMRNTERLQALITEGAPTERIKEAAVEEGMNTLLAYSLNLVRDGYTTFEEVERVTFTDSGLEAELKAKRKSSLTCKTCKAELQPDWLDCPYCLTPRFQD
ncbi:type II secretion system protein E [Rubidibacter lacunae KORDI 51-2]|uniref:Type II secretion system protein E n=1 Tax=Rubidibacter lacunae KORDI 51-2 TaxID=582515 RepID=U5DLZ1_9CHRO|nr:GspE/PulE family protein [Rubidibacter lacunae]ERN40730.1 type II secretion system protein E [Rubidibacter lacunae KORDI 51-2]